MPKEYITALGLHVDPEKREVELPDGKKKQLSMRQFQALKALAAGARTQVSIASFMSALDKIELEGEAETFMDSVTSVAAGKYLSEARKKLGVSFIPKFPPARKKKNS